MSLCGTCRHWGKPGETLIFRQCMAIHHDKNGLTHQYKEEENEFDPDEVQFRLTNNAVACDGSGYFACVRSREDFGCVLYEPEQ